MRQNERNKLPSFTIRANRPTNSVHRGSRVIFGEVRGGLTEFKRVKQPDSHHIQLLAIARITARSCGMKFLPLMFPEDTGSYTCANHDIELDCLRTSIYQRITNRFELNMNDFTTLASLSQPLAKSHMPLSAFYLLMHRRILGENIMLSCRVIVLCIF